MRVFLADLGHNLLTLSSDVYPLGIANLATYARAFLEHEEEVEFSLFREPQDLKAALDLAPPDVLGLSNYAWNQSLSRAFARHAKALRPDLVTVIGGPNWPLTLPEQEAFLRSLPEIDLAIEGPTYEGERAFLGFLQRFLDTGKSVAGLTEESVPGSVWIAPRTGEFVRGASVERIHDLDEIPSPYLAGLLDDFFATGYFPLMQITRGCPFTCTFCNSGVQSNSRVYAHSVENVKRDLDYIAARVKPAVNLCLADDNFGMYQRDEEIADYFAWLQDRYNWPRYVRTTTGKNNSERIIRVMRKTRGALPMTAAVQSMNPEVLKNIKRSNIKLETYRTIQEELERQGLQSYGELILCLPGETKESFLKAVEDFLDAGAKRISAHQLMLLHGAELSNPESREQFGFQTRFRVVARNIGDYLGDEPIIEVEEMVVETPQFSYADYLECRVFHLLLTVFYYEGNFEEAFRVAAEHGLKAYDLCRALQARLDRAPTGMRRLVDDFLRESEEELFPSREACMSWAQSVYPGLVSGDVGGNLLSKYSMIGRFYETHDALQFLGETIAAECEARGRACDAEPLASVIGYLETTLLHAPFAETVANCPTWTTRHDVVAWAEAGYARPLIEHRLAEDTTYDMVVAPETRALIETKIATFGEHPSGLGKFTRTMFARDLRRKPVRIGAPEGRLA